MRLHRPAVMVSVVGLTSLLIQEPSRAQETQTPYPPVQTSREVGGWTGHLNYVVGYKRLSSAWRPAADDFHHHRRCRPHQVG
jgi:hypothetical protein